MAKSDQSEVVLEELFKGEAPAPVQGSQPDPVDEPVDERLQELLAEQDRRQAEARFQVQLPAPVDNPPPLPEAGCITIRFYDSGMAGLVPKVSFAPLGRINPNTIEKHLPHIYREIARAQVQERGKLKL